MPALSDMFAISTVVANLVWNGVRRVLGGQAARAVGRLPSLSPVPTAVCELLLGEAPTVELAAIHAGNMTDISPTLCCTRDHNRLLALPAVPEGLLHGVQSDGPTVAWYLACCRGL